MMRLARNNRATRSSPTRPAAVPVLAALVLLLAGVLTSCAGDDGTSTNGTETTNGTESPGYTDIGPDELAGMLENKGFLFINVHIPYEGEIPLTDLFIPYDEAAGHVDQLPDDKDAKIVVYCQSDHVSRIAAAVWAEEGYTNLYNLDGGFVAWEEAGYEFIKDGPGAEGSEEGSKGAQWWAVSSSERRPVCRETPGV